ncbi:histidine kinase [Massilia sp.]|uniref:sensor histidine kinase n=1 Tax=Massilia sp. TaxID=1882437 RepID=UPI0028A11BA2|nr:histidine kinase [Massilia sp.]
MWQRLANWYREWDEELLAVLRDPAAAAYTPPGFRRRMATATAELSPIERQELYRICSVYRGRKLALVIGKLFLAFSVVGILFKLAYRPDLSLLSGIFVANTTGFTVVFAMVGIWFSQARIARVKREVVYMLLILGVVGGVYGSTVSMVASGSSWYQFMQNLPKTVVGVTIGVLVLVALPGVALTMVRNRHYALLAVQLAQEAEQARLARELSETQLRLLRAQIEPHFLFNTLGAVQQLAEQGAPRAAELTAHLIDFLRASTSDMRCEQVPLDTELRLVESYLRVMQIRLGQRLRFSIDLPPELAATQVPSMIVLTLAENAIKHGIEPSLRGGEIAVTVHQDEDRVRVRVRDSGVGMSDTPGNGTGLENVRHRLRLAYGESAGLMLSEAEPGLLAEIVIPSKERQ